jgi:NAD-dependent deacetylase
VDPGLVYLLDNWELKLGDKCEKGSQLRPHIVWFGEPVPMFEEVMNIAPEADMFLVVGTSMAVYPAAGLISYVRKDIPKYYVDPNAANLPGISNLEIIKEKAGTGLPRLVKDLLEM